MKLTPQLTSNITPGVSLAPPLTGGIMSGSVVWTALGLVWSGMRCGRVIWSVVWVMCMVWREARGVLSGVWSDLRSVQVACRTSRCTCWAFRGTCVWILRLSLIQRRCHWPSHSRLQSHTQRF